MNKFSQSILSTAYFPPVEYFVALANSEKSQIEQCEVYQKQSYRTRCHIYSANGLLVLTLPVLRVPVPAANPTSGPTAVPTADLTAAAACGEISGSTHKVCIRDIRIDYTKPWLLQHKRAIEAAYKSSPFFEYYADDLFGVLDRKEKFLLDLNYRLTELLAQLLGVTVNLSGTDAYMEKYPGGTLDLRERIHPKNKGKNLLQEFKMEKPYYQVFSDKQGFLSNLSVLDLLCNEGPDSISYLKISGSEERSGAARELKSESDGQQ